MKLHYFTFLFICLLASCSSELVDVADNSVNGDIEKVTLSSKPFEYEDDDTRTSLTSTDKSIAFAWSSTDAIGVFPISPTTNSQAKQEIKLPADCENDAHYASFDGAGWGLKNGNTYAAYTPYNGKIPSETSYTAVPIDMSGQDGTLATIGKKYDYMYATSKLSKESCSTNSTHEVVFDFKHAIAIVQLKLTMPVAAKWERVSLYGSDFFISNATMDVSTGEIAPLTKNTTLNLNLNNVSTSSADETIILYVAMLPNTTGILTVEAETSGHDLYVGALSSKELIAGKAYRLSTSLKHFVYPIDGYESGHEYVDLGLPSGLKWATMNVGASSLAGYGNYYAWGETEPQSNNSYTSSSYKWCNGTYTSMTKYCVSTKYGTVDNNTTLDSDDDAATVNWGGKWRMPTHAEQTELATNCYWVWTSSYNDSGKAGYIIYKAKSLSDEGQVVTSRNTPSSSYSLSDSHIFLPAAGYRSNGSLYGVGSHGGYWSSSLRESGSYGAWELSFDSSSRSSGNSYGRCYGQSVRAVCE